MFCVNKKQRIKMKNNSISYKELKITGITFLRHIYMQSDSKHYFGFDESGEVIKDIVEFDMTASLGGTMDEFISFITKAVEEINILSWNKEYFPEDSILDGEEWKIIIHIENMENVEIYGMNAYPDNFEDFIELCDEYEFGPYTLKDDGQQSDLETANWYDEFLDEIKALESKLICPKCSSDAMVHTDPMGYSFLCASCGYNYDYNEGKYQKHIDFEKKAGKS